MGSDGIAVLDAVRERQAALLAGGRDRGVLGAAPLVRDHAGIGDAYAGEWPRERFATHGITYELSDRNKSAIYQDFLPALNGRRLRLLDPAAINRPTVQPRAAHGARRA